jgi:hypothetical protein
MKAYRSWAKRRVREVQREAESEALKMAASRRNSVAEVEKAEKMVMDHAQSVAETKPEVKSGKVGSSSATLRNRAHELRRSAMRAAARARGLSEANAHTSSTVDAEGTDLAPAVKQDSPAPPPSTSTEAAAAWQAVEQFEAEALALDEAADEQEYREQEARRAEREKQRQAGALQAAALRRRTLDAALALAEKQEEEAKILRDEMEHASATLESRMLEESAQWKRRMANAEVSLRQPVRVTGTIIEDSLPARGSSIEAARVVPQGVDRSHLLRQGNVKRSEALEDRISRSPAQANARARGLSEQDEDTLNLSAARITSTESPFDALASADVDADVATFDAFSAASDVIGSLLLIRPGRYSPEQMFSMQLADEEAAEARRRCLSLTRPVGTNETRGQVQSFAAGSLRNVAAPRRSRAIIWSLRVLGWAIMIVGSLLMLYAGLSPLAGANFSEDRPNWVGVRTALIGPLTSGSPGVAANVLALAGGLGTASVAYVEHRPRRAAVLLACALTVTVLASSVSEPGAYYGSYEWASAELAQMHWG